ncbi:HlyD family efflux transporter periplasmic adaptor subunit [Caproicibacterium amylolyticum]|uniref:HlyD family efflux transporter periplasmic adaptor subunit n=1 Tax=Caproicibacterium amylolyticum TaxID=2766537 RepID=A0A7G9WIA0_9FIRM|nr:HlyD family efflux transporter periplasmic adaptor subunit [Caproicibacterium amylolyticum]QNO18412.1 HlyD family efflux transporter periplasmic adaptor subunit [Caproicibacterium amylolyticum]
MKNIIVDIDEFTDSREIMLSRPKPFVIWLIYIILAAFSTSIVWAGFSHIDEYVKVSGTVRPVSETASIKFPISGKIQSVYVKDGQTVKAGDTLLQINVKTTKNQKATDEQQLSILNKEINGTETLIKSIQSGSNQFNASDSSQNKYISKYNDYLSNVGITKTQYESNALDLKQTKLDAEKTISSTQKSMQVCTDLRHDYQTLMDSVSSNTNKFTSQNTICAKKYTVYAAKYQIAQQTCASDEEKLENAKSSGSSQDIINTIAKTISTDKNNLQSLVDSELSDIQTEITQLDSQLSEQQLAKDKAENLLGGTASKQNGEDEALEKLKLDTVTSLNSDLTALQGNASNLKSQIFELVQAINNATVKATVNGKVSLLAALRNNDLVAAGNDALTIVPQNCKQQVILYVPENNISYFKKGASLKYQIDSLPYKEYGEAEGIVTSISPDVITNQALKKDYYIVKGDLYSSSLKNGQGLTNHIQTGMSCQAKIIYGNKSVLQWISEKLKLSDTY